ncbi:hypothetical protein M758_1G272600 [Ceratodon purpureus]|nr:hypothetical protein M758_1G272600 [Ceratodon purpureus]
MEDSLAAFADMLEEDGDEGAGGLQGFGDYGRLYDYDNGFADFSEWEGVFESRQRVPQGLVSQAQVGEVVDQSGSGESVKMLMDEFGDASTLSQFQGGFNSAPSSDIAPPDPELQSEILELLSIFQAVHDNKSAIDTRSLLKKCIYMCERIMQRYYRLPDVVAIHEQAKALLQMFESVGPESPFARSNVSSNFATGNSTLSGPRSFRNNLLADVKEALDRVDRDAKESGDSKDPDEGRVVNGVYRCKGIWYCQVHTDQEQCGQCGVDYRLLNQVHRSRTEEAKVDDIVRKEQQRLEELERQHTSRGHADSRIQEGPRQLYINQDAEDFESIAKELNEELARARETDKVSSLKCFSPLFQISEERKLVL